MDDGVGVKDIAGESRSSALDDLRHAVHRSLKLDAVLDAVLDGVMEAVEGTSGARVQLLDTPGGRLFLEAHRGLLHWPVEAGSPRPGALTLQVKEQRGRLFIEDLSKDDRVEGKHVQKEKLQSFCGVPIRCEDELLGVLSAFTTKPTIFSDEDQAFLEAAGRGIGQAVKNAMEYEEAARRTRRYITVSRAITVTRQLAPLERVLQDIAKVLVQDLGFDRSWIALVDGEEGVLRGKAGFGSKKSGMDADLSLEERTDPAVAAVLEQEPVVRRMAAEASEEAPLEQLWKEGVQSFGYVPILSEERSVGAIGVFHTTDHAFDEEDIKTLQSVAEQAAIAIENARLYEEISKSEERYRTLFEASGTSLVILGEEHVFQLVNHAFEMLSGYDRKDLVGLKSFPEFVVDKEGELAGRLEAPPFAWEAEFKDKDGMIRQVHLTTARLPGTSNLLVSVIDMTKEREIERHLFRTEELAAIGELSAGIAHEIRNPLVAITTSVNLLKDEAGLSEEGCELLGVVKEESDHLAAIVEDFLRFARPKKPVFDEVDVAQLLADTVRRCRDWDIPSIDLIEAYDKKLPRAAVDRHQIQQVVTNLLLNGVDAMEGVGILEVAAKKVNGPGQDRIRITVRDSGNGIPEEEMSKIFQPFYSTKSKGTGLGLAICRRIVYEHGGEISVDSTLDEGTSFSVVLPVAPHQRAAAD